VPQDQRPPLPFPGQFRLELQPQKLLWGVLGLLIVATALTCVYQVPANSQGLVQRFGAFLELTNPGLQFKFPLGIDRVTILEVSRQQKLEFGFATEGATNPYQFSEDRWSQEAEKDMVTGDLNSAVVEWVVQYSISDAKNYVFNFRDPAKTLRDLSEAVMREVVGDRTVDEVLTIGRTEMEITAVSRLKELVNGLHMGVSIDQIQLRNVAPPPQVKTSFDEVNSAKQQRESLINQASGEYNKVIPEARGIAEQKIMSATGYATKRINEAEGDATRFNSVLAEYSKAPEVTRKRLFLETMAEILPTIPGKVIIDDKAPQFLPMMPLRQSTPVYQQQPQTNPGQ
jgi:modulator of FtsH protease HflK